MRRYEEDDQYVNPPVAASIIALCSGLVVGLAPFLPTARARYIHPLAQSLPANVQSLERP